MTNYTTFDINENVAVRLTPYGKSVLREKWEMFWSHQDYKLGLKYKPPVEDEEGWSVWTMRQLFETFGHHTWGNGYGPFETTIRIENEEVGL